MNRRDTIIVAVLINIALLGALFMLATPKEQTSELHQVEKSFPLPVEDEKSIAEEAKTPDSSQLVSGRDEIDEMLKEYAANTLKTDPKALLPSQKVDNEPATSEEEYVNITVKRGDYLEKIARANGTTIGAIMRANNLQNVRIDVGQTLRIPIKKKKENPPQPSEQDVVEPTYYTMKSGDNPWKIAKQNQVKFDELLQLNDLNEAKARQLKPGDVLRVR